MKYGYSFRQILLLFVLLAFIPLYSSGVRPIQRMGNADVQLFDGGWLFKRWGLQADGSYVPEPAGLERIEADDTDWRILDLPHDWAIEGPFRTELAGETGKLPYKGIGWYRKHFVFSAKDGNERVYLDFDGAMANAQVWLNGKYVGTWPYGYNSFRMDLTPFLVREGGNVLAVRLDTEKWESRWYCGAGIYRHVWLVRCSPVHVAQCGTYITTPEISEKLVKVKTEITVENHRNSSVEARLVTDFFELGKDDRPGRKMASGEAVLHLPADSSAKAVIWTDIRDPKRWDIEFPHRYVAITRVRTDGQEEDVYHTPFGVRSIEFTVRNGFLLNGRRVEIKGVCNHHDLGALGGAINTSALKRQLAMLQEMGCNSVRTSHNPPAPELLELADKMGILVWDEAFDAWKKGKRKWDYNVLYEEWHQKDLLAMVYRDRNHPSVVIWSVGNEVFEQRDEVMTRHLADIVRRADPTRPVSNGYNDPDGGRASGAATALDVMGVNYFFGQQAKWDADKRYADMPTLGSETSSCVSSRGEYFGASDYEGWQITSYDRAAPGWGCSPDAQFRIMAKFPHLLGEYVWTGFDYIGEPTPYNSSETNLLNFRNDPAKKAELEKALKELKEKNPPSRSSYFGIIDMAGFPKDRYFLYQSHWRPEQPVAHILPHWNWPEKAGEVVPVHVYTSGNEAELFVNGRSMGKKMKRPGLDFRLVWDSVRYEPGCLNVIAYKDGKKWAEAEMRTTGDAYQLEPTADRRHISSDGTELAFITVAVADSNGLTVPRSHPLIRFSVEGPGEIVATDNGNAIDFTSFQSHTRNAFNGLALVIVKARKNKKGKITVKAECESLKPGEVVVRSE